ncbi:M48 family metallopeptidase [Chitinophaga arvensicola]|uniref:Zn-dependent protease with chaperone function n=1 Tax=Chitinophaga arvensicola TaxID=29529 RepID=A0A1I0QMD3_9BACT|nr:M48 family metallopeptidase [Chitinophaga arvensicola]SEW28170.1 Zn-dependent protease with chaperone function [Chitinophaga arvensicola]
MTNLYPECPENADLAFIEPTLLFRQQIMKAVSCVVLFFILYVVLLFTAVALAIAFVSGGVALFRAYPAWTTSIISLSLILLGVMVIFFLIKFLFNKRPAVNPYRTQIFADHHPLLFDFITQLVKDTRISFPKKIFIVPDMNATVFYHSSFLSLFWPAGKNLEIGLGLINSVNISEFKMLLTHEFAHFSQRSMKLGSYIYALNKMLYNMLYENDRWNEIEVRWSRGSSLLSFFAHITTRILNAMQFVLRKIYAIINRQYLELSREMEYYADTVAVGLTSTDTAISSLRRVEMGGYCLDHCFHKLPDLAERTLRFPNIFTAQRAMIRYYASQNHLALDESGLPVITDHYFHTFLKSRVQLREQWTAHLSREARETHYLQAGISCKQFTDSAWTLFNEPEHLQEYMTSLVYNFTVHAGAETFTEITPAAYIDELSQRHRLYEYPKAFNDYYDNRPFADMNGEFTRLLSPEEMEGSLREIYHPDNIVRMRAFYRDRQDAETLQAISCGQFQTNYFEFDGHKYSAARAKQLARMLSAEVANEQEWLKTHDQQAFRYHYTVAMQHSPAVAALLKEKYTQILQYQQTGHQLNEQVIRIIHCISLLFNSGEEEMESMPALFDELSAECWGFRMMMENINQAALFNNLPPGMTEKLQRFREHDCTFMQDMIPDYVAIQELHEISSVMMEHFNNGVILLKKAYLEFLLTLEPGE